MEDERVFWFLRPFCVDRLWWMTFSMCLAAAVVLTADDGPLQPVCCDCGGLTMLIASDPAADAPELMPPVSLNDEGT